MKNYKVYAIAITILLTFSASKPVLTMSKDQYQSAKRSLADEFGAGKKVCRALSGNSIDLCSAEAHRQYKVATAVLEARYNPSPDGAYKALVAIADADYLVARRKCDDLAGQIKNRCRTEARAVQIAAKSEAVALHDTSISSRIASDRASAARKSIREEQERTEASKDTAAEKDETDVQVARERREILRNDARLGYPGAD